MMPLLNPALAIAERGGMASRAFHRWLGLVARAAGGPFIGDQSNGSFVIKEQQYALIGKRLRLKDKERLTMVGVESRLVICG